MTTLPDESPAPSLSRVAPHSGILFILASNTEEKAKVFDGIAAHPDSKRRYGGRIHVMPLSGLELHPSPDETQENCDAIAGNKLREALPVFNRVRPGDSLHRDLKKILRTQRMSYDAHHTVLFSEDSIFGIPTSIYSHLQKRIEPLVNPGMATNTEPHVKDGKHYTLMIDFGPIKEAIGTYKFFDLIRESALEAKHQGPVELINKVSCSVVRLSDSPEAPPHKPIVAATLTYLHAPDGLDKPLRKPEGLLTPSHFQSELPTMDRPVSSHIDDHLLNYGFRRAMLDKLVAWAAKPLHDTQDPVKDCKQTAQQVTIRPVKPKIVQMTPGSLNGELSNQKPLGKHTVQTHIPNGFDALISATGLEFAQKTSGAYTRPTADVVIIPPWHAHDQESRIKKIALISSLLPARQLDPRYTDTAFIIINKDGCHDNAIHAMEMFANHGFSADYHRTPLIDKRPHNSQIVSVSGVQHRATRYFDILDGSDDRALNRAVRQVAEFRMKNYRRTQHEPAAGISGEDNIAKPSALFAVGAMMSANNEGLHLGQATAAYGQFLAQENMGAVWGGMNKPPGETFYTSYVKANGPFLMATSTHDIVKKETREGHLPAGVDAWHIRRSISDRILDIMNTSDAFVSFHGGPGTLQEDAAVMAGKIMAPARYGQKPLTFFAPELGDPASRPWENSAKGYSMKLLLGVDKIHHLCRDHTALADQGIFLATSQTELQSLTLEHRRQHERNLMWQQKDLESSRPANGTVRPLAALTA